MTHFETPDGTPAEPSAKTSAGQLMRQVLRAGQRNPAAFRRRVLQLLSEERQRRDRRR